MHFSDRLWFSSSQLSEEISITKIGKCLKSVPLPQRASGETSASTALSNSTGYTRAHSNARLDLQDAQATVRPCGRD